MTKRETPPAHRRGHSPSLHRQGARNTRMRFIYLEMLDIQKKLVPRKGLGLDPSNYSKNRYLPLRQVRHLYHWSVLVSILLWSSKARTARAARQRPEERFATVWHGSAQFGRTAFVRASRSRRSFRNPRQGTRSEPERPLQFSCSAGSGAVLASVPAESSRPGSCRRWAERKRCFAAHRAPRRRV